MKRSMPMVKSCAARARFLLPGRPPFRRSRFGFTLVELLVVIAIIAVLAALGFNVYAKVKQGAGMAKCASNMRQWGMGFQSFMNDHDGYLPQYFEIDGNNDSTWQELIAPYLVGPKEKPTDGARRFLMRQQYPCPTNPQKNGIEYGSIHWLQPKLYNQAPSKLVTLEHPLGRFLLLVENFTGEVWDTTPSSPGKPRVDYERHGGGPNGKANFLFADLHVEALSYPQTLEEGVISKP